SGRPARTPWSRRSPTTRSSRTAYGKSWPVASADAAPTQASLHYAGRVGTGADKGAVTLAEVRGAMAVVFCGLSDQWAEILADDDLDPGLIPADTHDTMRLPSSCARFGSAREKRGWDQVAGAHPGG